MSSLVSITGSRNGVITNAAIPLSLTSSNFDFSSFRSDGADLVVMASDGSTALGFYIEAWDSNAQTATVWINVPSLPVGGAGATSAWLLDSSNTVTDGSFDDTFHKLVAGDDTLGLYHFDEGSGTTSADSSGNGLTATLVGTPTWGSEATRWKYTSQTFSSGHSITLNGSTQYISIPNLLDACPPALTVSLSFTPTDGSLTSGQHMLWRKVYSTNHFLEVFFFNGKLFVSRSGNQEESATLTWTPGVQYTITFVLTSTRMQLWLSDPSSQTLSKIVDYRIVTQPSPSDVLDLYGPTYPASGLVAFTLGAQQDGGVQLATAGTFDELIVEARAWTQNEIEARMVNLTSYIPADERSYWSMDAVHFDSSWNGGEASLLFNAAVSQRLHMIHNLGIGGAGKLGYSYSDDYGDTWTHNNSNGSPLVGGGAAGISGDPTHSGALWADDGYGYIYFALGGSTNVYAVRSTSPNDFTSFTGGTSNIVLTASEFTDVNAFYNISVCLGPGNLYYLVCDGTTPSTTFQTYIATSASPLGPFTAVQAGPLTSQLGIPAGRTADAPCIKYDASTGKLHLYAQHDNLPAEVYHFIGTVTSLSPVTITWAEPSDSVNPAIAITVGDGTGSPYADQAGDQEGTTEIAKTDGSYLGLMVVDWLDNRAATTGFGVLHRFNGSIAELNAADTRATVSKNPKSSCVGWLCRGGSAGLLKRGSYAGTFEHGGING